MSEEAIKIVFMGTPEFACATLKELVEKGYNVAGVVTAPDKPAGRGQKLSESAVKTFATANGIKILQPTNMKSPDFLEELDLINADLQIVVAFRMLPEAVWRKPRLGTFNLHASLLPQYRGAAPINHAIINGEKKSGVTTFFIDEKIDTGEIIDHQEVMITPTMNAGELHDRLMETGAKLVLKTVDAIIDGSIKTIPQEAFFKGDEPLKHAPKIFKESCLINWDEAGEKIYNLIRGLSPYPTAWSNLFHTDDKLTTSFKIFDATFEPNPSTKSGQIMTDQKKSLKIGCKNGWICVKNLQLAGKKRMSTEDLLRGFLCEGYRAG